MNVKTAVIPVAGKGTRFLPATKAISKEIIPILNVPMIYYVVKEAVDSGIERIVFVTSSGKEEIENFFDHNPELELFLEGKGKTKELEMVRNLSNMIEISTVRQKEQLGLGHAVNCAAGMVGNGPFAVLLGDDLIVGGKTPATKQLIEISQRYDNSSVIGVMQVPKEDTNKYGIVDGEVFDGNELLVKMKTMVEKPDPAKAPTNLATPGRYILDQEIFECLDKIPRGAGGEYQLTDAINMLCTQRQVLAYQFEGRRYDTGSATGYLEATIDFALEREDLRDYALELMKSRV